MDSSMAMIWFVTTVVCFTALLVVGTFLAKHVYDPHRVRKHHDWHFHRHA